MIHSAPHTGFRPLPHYSHWAALVGVSVLTVLVIVALIAATRSGRRRR